MPTTLPANRIEDALKLKADAIIDLFELNPLIGGTVYFKADNSVTWRGNLYQGLPCQLSGEEKDTKATPTPRMTIGQEDADLLPFKALVHDGLLDGATIIKRSVLLADLKANLDIKSTVYYRVKRIEGYSRNQISMVLASFSSAVNQTMPFRQYLPPSFPYVDL